jgi:hypothetical protein
MDHGTSGKRCWQVAAALLAAGMAGASAASTVWQRDWEDTGALVESDSFGYGALLRPSTNGEFVFVQSRESDVAAVRVRADGSLRWQSAAGYGAFSTATDAIVFDDGSAAQLQSGSSNGYLARLGTDGQPVWGMALPANRLASAGSAIVASGCYGGTVVATGLDANNGTVRWQRIVQGGLSPCPTVSLAGAASGESYLGYYVGNTFMLLRLDAQGQMVWSANSTQSGSVALAASGSNVYTLGTNTLTAFGAADGVSLWQSVCINPRLYFVDGDPVCATGVAQAKRLAAASGSQVWARTASGGTILGVFDGDVYYGANGTWQRWAGASGAGQWQVPLANLAQEHNRVWSAGTGFVAFLSTPTGVPNDIVLKRYRLSDGAEIGSTALPTIARGVVDQGRVRDGTDLFVRGLATASAQPERLRRLDADTGVVNWERSSARGAPASTFATTASTLYLAERYAGVAQLRALDRADGATRWTEDLAYSGGNWSTSLSPRLFGHGSGDVIAFTGQGVRSASSFDTYSETQLAWRFAALDGASVWERTLSDRLVPATVLDVDPPTAMALGDDVIVAPWLSVSPAPPMQRLDSANGQATWSQTTADTALALAAAHGEDAFFSVTGGLTAGSAVTVNKRSAATGATLWSLPIQQPAGRSFAVRALVALSDGDVVLAGNSVIGAPGAASAITSARVLRISADGSGLRYYWAASSDASLPTDSLVDFTVDAAGRGWFYRLQHDRRIGLAFLVRFDVQQGRQLGAQAYRPSFVTPLMRNENWNYELMPYRDDQMIDSGFIARAPQPSARRDALRDYAIVQRGDLALSIGSLPATFAPGTQLPLSVRVNYDGDAPLAGVTLILDPPWHGTTGNLTCGGSGVSLCSVDATRGQIVVRFDAAPGARMTLSGQIRALSWPVAAAAVPRGVVYAPEGLLESDTLNNFRAVSATAPIFKDGFESP